MDTWKFYDITHREHVVCNPTSEEPESNLDPVTAYRLKNRISKAPVRSRLYFPVGD